MQTKLTSGTNCKIVLLQPSDQLSLATQTLAQHLRIPVAEAQKRLGDAPGSLCDTLPVGRARRLGTMLRLLGLRVVVLPESEHLCEPQSRFEVSLQTTTAEARGKLAAVLHSDFDISCPQFDTPAGVVVEGLAWVAVSALRRKIKGIAGARILISDMDTATYDLIPWGRPVDPESAIGLARHLRRLGIERCPLTGAIGADLDHVLRRHVMSRFHKAGVVALNRDFQRFDLVLTDAPDPSRRELADFLARRTNLPPAAFNDNHSQTAKRIECGLTRASAMAFQADYAAIGIETRAQLVLAREVRPI